LRRLCSKNEIELPERPKLDTMNGTLAKQGVYNVLTQKQITTYAESKGYVFLDQITADDIDLFWANWKLGPRAKGKRLTTLRAFFRFCVNRVAGAFVRDPLDIVDHSV